jgi:sugar/nucleoside kinase (ribokinase family)/pimeloyl-ACP methyl ester carboxylesterase
MPQAPVICSLGELLVEFILTETDGRNLRAAPYVGPFPSGAHGIFIDQAARVGGRAVFAGAVGDDAFGQVLRDRLAQAGVSGGLIRVVPGLPTGTAHVSCNSDGSRDSVFGIAASAAGRFPDGDAAVDAFLAAGVRVLHISGPTLGDPDMRVRALAICRGLRAQGVAISVDPNIRTEPVTDAGYLEVVRRLMGMAAYVLPSDADAALLFPGQGFAGWSAGLLAGGTSLVALKRGADGAVARDAGGTVQVAGHSVEVVDPTGAGDCFCGTLVPLLAAGMPLDKALVRANAAGTLAVTRLGPMEGNCGLSGGACRVMTPTGWLERDGLRLAVHDAGGAGLPVVFQHGLCGDVRQVAEAFPPDPAFRRASLDCRGHGASDAGEDFSIATFAGAVAALAETLPGPVVLGGISMGAAIALRLAVLRPDLVRALILVRPAWDVQAAPPNMAPNAEAGARLDPEAARAVFAAGDTARRLAVEAPDNLASLMGFFDRPPREITARLRSAISADGPGVTAAEVAGLRLPVLVCGTPGDAVHPLALARGLADRIPQSSFVVLPPKGRDRPAHIAALHAAIRRFLKELQNATPRPRLDRPFAAEAPDRRVFDVVGGPDPAGR